MRIVRSLSLVLLLLALLSCSGGSAKGGLVLEGLLIQGTSTGHARLLHSEGQFIGNVEICAFGACSITDENGQWGFATETAHEGGPVTLSINGHGIATQTPVELPAGAQYAVVELTHSDGAVEAHLEALEP